MAKLIAQGIEHPGFSFIHALSQCITFCPEQTDWKSIVNEREEPTLQNADEAARLFMHESGFQTGLLFAQDRPPWPPQGDKSGACDSDELARGFRVS